MILLVKLKCVPQKLKNSFNWHASNKNSGDFTSNNENVYVCRRKQDSFRLSKAKVFFGDWFVVFINFSVSLESSVSPVVGEYFSSHSLVFRQS